MKGGTSEHLPKLLLLMSTLISGCLGLEVNSIEGPSVVVNGSMSQLVLDCTYDLTDYDKTGLVIKWYFQRKPYPVYQWIPKSKPQGLGILKGRLNLDYQVSPDEYTKHRALAILNPTTELTGEYTCLISSYENEDFKRKILTIYAPPSDMTLTYSKPRKDSVVVTCRAGGVFPAPNIAIYRSSSVVRKDRIEEAKVETHFLPNRGFYNITVELEAFDYDLDGENQFECVLTIPGTDFQMNEEVFYSPEPTTTATPTTIAGENASGETENDNNGGESTKTRIAESSSSGGSDVTGSGAGKQMVVGSWSFVSILTVFYLYLHYQ